MIICILAGGSGTRLWPLSQSNYPKHLLALTGEESMLQKTVERVSLLTDTIYIVPEQSHAEQIYEQVPQIPRERILVEPGRRGTASCIVLALAAIKQQLNTDEPVVFCHADSHIADSEEFAKDVKEAAEASAKHHSITMIGVRPTYAATGFGYIERGKLAPGEQEIYEVASFKEKPDGATANRYVKAGRYWWNMGMFAAPTSVFEEAFKHHAPELEQAYTRLCETFDNSDDMNKAYLELENQPIDTALIEKTANLLVIPAVFDWADIGSFYDLHNILQNEDKLTLKGDIDLTDSEDVMVHSTTGRPVVIIGLKDMVVIDTPEGLLVSAKGKSQRVGEAAKRIQARKKD